MCSFGNFPEPRPGHHVPPPLFFFGWGEKSVFLKKKICFLNWKIIALQNFVGFFTFVKLQEEWTKTPQDACPVGVRKGDIHACAWAHTHWHSHQESNCMQLETHRQDWAPLYRRKYHSDYQASPVSNLADYQDFLLVFLVMLSIFLV